jgi:hypothetical protein
VRARADQWTERVRAWRSSGLEADEFARGKDFTGRMLRWWAGEFVRRGRSKVARESPVAMARVIPPGSILRDVATEPALASLVGRFRIAVSPGFDEALLRSVLRVVAEER